MMHPACWSIITDHLKNRAGFFFSPGMEILLSVQLLWWRSVRCCSLSWRIYKLRANSSSTSRLAKLLSLSLSLSLSVKPQHKPEFGFFFLYLFSCSLPFSFPFSPEHYDSTKIKSIKHQITMDWKVPLLNLIYVGTQNNWSTCIRKVIHPLKI